MVEIQHPLSSMAEFPGHRPSFSCLNCRTPVAFWQDIISKEFWGKSGRAYLFRNAVNIVVGEKEEKQLITGLFTIANISCSKCGEVMGWKYVQAHELRERYKEGMFIIERSKIAKEY